MTHTGLCVETLHFAIGLTFVALLPEGDIIGRPSCRYPLHFDPQAPASLAHFDGLIVLPKSLLVPTPPAPIKPTSSVCSGYRCSLQDGHQPVPLPEGSVTAISIL